MSTPVEETVPVDRYLARIGVVLDGSAELDHALLTSLMRAHLTAVPFENLDVAAGVPVSTELPAIVDKIVNRRRGGWCFELNGAFCALLSAIGFDARLIGAAVLLDGPNVMVDHATIEVMLDEPWLVDVGFGDSFITPLALNRSAPQPGGNGDYQFIASPQGTTLAHLDDDVPVAQFRFKRVGQPLSAFEPSSAALQADDTSHFRTKPFATRLIDGGPDRVTILRDRIKIVRAGVLEEAPLSEGERADLLQEWMGLSDPA